jgi:hypothetical protein
MTDKFDLTREEMFELAREAWHVGPWVADKLRARGCPESEVAKWRWRIGHLPVGEFIDKGFRVDEADKAEDLDDVAARLPALERLKRDVEYRLPESGNPLAHVVLTHAQAAELLTLCESKKS